MKKLLLLLMFLPLLAGAQTSSELMARWGVSFNWFTFNYNPDIEYLNNAATSISVGNVTGNGINLVTDLDGYTGTNWPVSSTAPEYSKYFQFTVAPVQGKNLQPKHFRFQQDGTCRKFEVRYSTDPAFPNNGTLLVQNTNASAVQDQNITVAFPSNVTVASGQTLYIRVYGYYKNTGSTWTINHNGLLSGNAPEFYGVATSSITANPDTATTFMGQPVNINVVNNDVASSTTISSVSILTQSNAGTAVVQPNKTITFTPNLLFIGNTTFQYKITAANGAIATATVTVTVSPIVPVVANNDTVTLIKNTTKAINIMANDVQGSGLITSVAITTNPLHGTITIVNNVANYTPAANYVGTDTFKYTLTDLFNNTSTATVNLTVSEPVLPAPGTNNGVYCASSTTWNGNAWSNGTPNDTKDAIIAGDYTINGGTLTACSLYVTGNAQVLFKNQSKAVITHAVNVAATASLTFESSSNLIQIQDTPNTGNVTIKRFGSKLKRLDYTFWSSPVTGTQTLQEFSPATLPNRFYIYKSETNSYFSVPAATTTFAKARAYLIRMPDAITTGQATAYAAGNYRFSYEGVFTGVPNNGNVTIPLVYVDGTNCFNGVGNPYPSPISITKFILANINNIEGTIWIWRKTNNPDETSYCTLTTLGFIANNALGGGGANGNDGNDLVANPWIIDPEGVLNTGQGFIVKAKNNNNLVFNNSMRKQNNFINFFRNGDNNEAEPDDSAVVASRIWLNASNSAENVFAQTMVGYTSQATLGYDDGIDGKSLANGSIALYSVIDDAKLVIQGRPDFTVNDVVKLGFMAEVPGEYIIKLDHVDGLFTGNQNIYIKDNITGLIQNIKEGDYTFTTEAGTFEERFEVVYTTEELGTGQVDMRAKDVVIYGNGQQVKITSAEEIKSIIVYDLLGKVIYNDNNINSTEYTSRNISSSQQVVIVCAELSTGVKTTRKIVLK